MRFLGAKWLARLPLSGEIPRGHDKGDAGIFFKLFLGVELDAKEAKAVLRQ